MTLGIIDVGTNSIHLIIGIIGLDGRFHVLAKERELARLGAGGLASGKLTNAAMSRAEKVLARYASIIKRAGVDRIEAVATSAVRDAKNGKLFVRRIQKKLKLPLRIINGHEEARLIYLGVLQTAGLTGSTLMISLGGGSAEIMVGDGRQLRLAFCRPLGCARLSENFIKHDPAKAGETEALRKHVRRALRPIARSIKRYRWQTVIGTSATIEQVLLAAWLSRYGKTREQSPAVNIQTLRKMVGWLETSNAGQRKRLDGFDPKRQDLALATGITLLEFMEACSISKIQHAPGSLREGLVVDYLIRHHKHLARPFERFEAVNAGGIEELTPGWRKRIMPIRASER